MQAALVIRATLMVLAAILIHLGGVLVEQSQ